MVSTHVEPKLSATHYTHDSLFNSGITDIIVYVGSDTSAPDCIFRKLGYEVVDDAEWIEWAYEGVNAVPW